MKKKNIILVSLFSFFALSCSTLQEKLGAKRRNENSRSGTSKTNKDENENSEIADNNQKKEVEKERKKEMEKSTSRYENSVFSEKLSNDSLVMTKINEIHTKNRRISVNGSSEEIYTAKLQNALLTSFKSWKGTRYAFGGDSQRGIDCSALTRRVYREVFSYELPRVTTDQIKVGKHVSMHNLKPGDILFFRPEGKYNHTAVYLGNSLFINASSSKGVILSSLENKYWKRYFKHGVRVGNIRANV